MKDVVPIFNQQALPTRFAGFRLGCESFGVNMPQLESALCALRKLEKLDADKNFPKRLNRVMLGKAERTPHEKEEGLCTVAMRALHGCIRFAGNVPLRGATPEFAERLTLDLAKLYGKVICELKVSKIPVPEIMRVFVQELFLPTFFLHLQKVRHRGLGNEFSINDCWYLPFDNRGQMEYPFPRVLRAWLNAAGFRYAEDVGKQSQRDSDRKIISNWLGGRNVPAADVIYKFVDRFENETRRFDEAGAWKGRLAFAAAMHRLCRRMDEAFLANYKRYTFKLLGMLQEIEGEKIPVDNDRVLANWNTFFAARLVYRRLKSTPEWQRKMSAIPKGITNRVSDFATEIEIANLSEQMERNLNPGNILLDCILNELSQHDNFRNGSPTHTSIHDQIFSLGITELNNQLSQGAGD